MSPPRFRKRKARLLTFRQAAPLRVSKVDESADLTYVFRTKRRSALPKIVQIGRCGQHCQPIRSLRSSGSHQLVKSRHNLSFGSRAFRISAAHIWNSLPTNIREAQSTLTFRRYLKTHYFQSAFSTPSDPTDNAP